MLVSCNRKSLDEQQDKHNEIYVLNKLDLQYYPSFTDLLGVEVDFEKKKYLDSVMNTLEKAIQFERLKQPYLKMDDKKQLIKKVN